MASLIGLPNELIDLVCEYDGDITLALRLTCRQLYGASFHRFLAYYFGEVTVLAHPQSIAVLRDIVRDERFANAIWMLCIDVHEVFDEALKVSHHDLITDGIVRQQLAEVLSQLPKCTQMHVSRETSIDILGRSRIPFKFLSNRKDKYIERDTALWMSSNGFSYSSYAICDVIHAITSGSHSLEWVDIPMLVEYGPLSDYLRHKRAVNQSSRSIKHLEISLIERLWDGDDEFVDVETMALIMSLWPPEGPLTDLVSRFGALEHFGLCNNMVNSDRYFPSSLPQSLRCLAYSEVYHAASAAKRLIKCLGSLYSLEELDLGCVGFDNMEECNAFLQAVAKQPHLKTFVIVPALCYTEERGKILDMNIHQCGADPETDGLLTKDPKKDIPEWIESMHVCTCIRAEIDDSDSESEMEEQLDEEGSQGNVDSEISSDDESDQDDVQPETHTHVDDSDESDSIFTDGTNLHSEHGSSGDEASVNYEHATAAESQEIWHSAGVSRR